MRPEDFGYNDKLEKIRNENNLKNFEIGRVVSEHKERYIVRTVAGDLEAEITGNLRFSAKSCEDFPAVGDWVALITYDPDLVIIHKILPRLSMITRQAAGQCREIQVIAANIDYVLIIQSVDKDFNLNRIERYLTICYSSKVSPIIVLTKTDLIQKEKTDEAIDRINQRIENIPVIAISNETQDGYDTLKMLVKKGKTYCMLGSSGVGKSTLMNNLSGKTIIKTDAISKSTNKGRHVTSYRSLIVLDNGGILIDNPGIREVGITDTSGGLETAFDKIICLSENCRFKNCTHTGETGCAVLEAVEKGEIDKDFRILVKNYKRDIKKYKFKKG